MENHTTQHNLKENEDFKCRGNWNKQSVTLKINYPHLTSEDVTFKSGQESQLISRLQNKLGKNRKEVIELLKANYRMTANSV